MKRLSAIFCVLGALAFTGCMTAAKQTLYTIMGPQGEYLIIKQNVEGTAMRKYRDVEVVDFVNDIPTVIKPNLAQAVAGDIVERLKAMDDKRLEEGKPCRLDGAKRVDRLQTGAAAAPTVVITGRLLDITSDKIPGQKLVMGGNHLIARVLLTDKATGDVLVEANLRGIVKSVADTGEESLATGMSKGAEEILERLCQWKEQDKEAEAAN